jgi:hypothetical protein
MYVLHLWYLEHIDFINPGASGWRMVQILLWSGVSGCLAVSTALERSGRFLRVFKNKDFLMFWQ